jgi:ADP-ribosylglycohydrolase
MGVAVYETLARLGWMDQDALAAALTRRYLEDPRRGYGRGAHELIGRIAGGIHWREASASLFDGRGSYGNGAAMRVGPLGAYFHDSFLRCAAEARDSAEVTHAHDEGKAGAIAIASAAGLAVATRDLSAPMAREQILDKISILVPDGETRSGIEAVKSMDPNAEVDVAVRCLGNGSKVSAQDTVPFALWAALSSLDSYSEALWKTVGGLGDRDTTCAIVGGIVAGRVGREGIPQDWRTAREPLLISGERELVAGQAELGLKRVLVIDGDRHFGSHVEYALRGRFAVVWADPIEALEVYGSDVFDLVTTANILHPDIDGYQMIDRIRERRPDQLMLMMLGTPSEERVAKAAKRRVKCVWRTTRRDHLIDLVTDILAESDHNLDL